MKKFIACLLFLASSMTVVADEAKYNPNSKILKIPVIKIGDSYVYDAELLNNDGFFSLLSYSVNATKNTPKPTSSS
ncbi:MAG: hypothetical protein KAU26_04525, partial [Methylococcales bacterium]|nr:hypothetical protein [Methylococcales bacterium]